MAKVGGTVIALLLGLVLTACGGGSLSGGSSSPSPPPPVLPSGFVYVSNTSISTLTGIAVAGGKPSQLATALPSPGAGPSGMVATGKWLYVADSGSAMVSGFSFDANTGGLQPLPGSPYLSISGIRRLALCPANGGPTVPRFIYGAAASGVVGYSIASNGRLTVLPGSPFTAGSQPSAVAVDTNCNFVFVANQGSNNISVLSVNPTTGFLTAVPGSPFAAGSGPSALAMGDGFLFVANGASSNVSVFTINTGTGHTGGVLIQASGSPFSSGTAPSGLAYKSPTLYVANSGSNNVSAFSVTLSSGFLTPIAGSPFLVGTTPKDMIAFSPRAINVQPQFFLYVANSGSNNLSGFTIGAGGALTIAPGFPFPAGNDPETLVFACGQCGYP